MHDQAEFIIGSIYQISGVPGPTIGVRTFREFNQERISGASSACFVQKGSKTFTGHNEVYRYFEKPDDAVI